MKRTVPIIKDAVSRRITISDELKNIGAADDAFVMVESDKKMIKITKVV